jgi:hypothetical protein
VDPIYSYATGAILLKRIDWRWTFLTLILCWACLETGLRLGSDRIWGRLGHSDPLSLALLQDRISAFQSARKGKKLCITLGDSVFFGSALREKGYLNWARLTPPALLRAKLGPSWIVLDLSADGLQIPDLYALQRAAAALKPDAIVLELNMRMLAVDGDGSPGDLSRPWLSACLPESTLTTLPPRPTLGFEKRSFSLLHDDLSSVSAVFRYSELARDLLFQPSFKELAAKWIKAWMPEAEDSDGDIQDSLLDMKIRPYYAGPPAGPRHAGRLALVPLAQALKASGARTFVFLTPQNMERISDFLDRPTFKANRSAFKAPFKEAGVPYQDLAEWVPPGRFLDHCHLDPQGNEALSSKIYQGLQ